jgi:hypothetical protein
MDNQFSRADPANNLGQSACAWLADAFEKPGCRGLQHRCESNQSLGGDTAAIAAFHGSLEVANRIGLLCRERCGMG